MAPDSTSASATSKSASKKKRKSKKKSSEKQTSAVEDSAVQKNGTEDNPEEAEGEDDGEDDEVDASRQASVVEPEHVKKSDEDSTEKDLPIRNGTHDANSEVASKVEQVEEQSKSDNSDTTAKLDAMARDRAALREEVAELRKSLEDLRTQHEGERTTLKEEVETAQAEKEDAEEQYRTLLGKVNTIRSQLGERLKSDAADLAQARQQIEELQTQNRELEEKHDVKEASISRLTAESKTQAEEISDLRSRSNLSTTNWSKERDDLVQQLAYAREEFEDAKQAMQDWEVLAMEERSQRETLGERTGELEEQLASLREVHERVLSERDGQNSTVDGLQRALQEIQEARKQELREMVESSQTQLDALRKQADEAAQRATESANKLETTQKELERYMPFEKEVKEKNLLIGKLRHEAVILNDHLTKALRFLKRGKPEDNVDRQIVTNHMLHFLALDRSDPKKFQVLQLMAALLGWTDEQREQAGLSRPGASNTQLRVPLSPFRRIPSTPTLQSEFVTSPSSASRESLAELWSDFLEREAEEGGGSAAGSRRGSAAVGQRSSSVAPTSNRRNSSGLGIRAVSGPNRSIPETPEEPHPPLPSQ